MLQAADALEQLHDGNSYVSAAQRPMPETNAGTSGEQRTTPAGNDTSERHE
jgi:hypothetical protein